MKTVRVITTLAEYQTRFWLRVGLALRTQGEICCFVSFDDRSTEMLRENGFSVVSANEIEAPEPAARRSLFDAVGIDRLGFWMTHERFAFGRTDDSEMERKLARAILATRQAFDVARERGSPMLIQEVGGFLSVVGAYFAALSQGVTNWFIEPSFFRGRLLFTKDTFQAPNFASDAKGQLDPDFMRYLESTLASGALVIPHKDRHHYSPARRKVFNLRNAKRLVEKLIDKHVLGKRQEFGFIGSHVALHLSMLRNSRKLSAHYSDPGNLPRFVYYPLHVPGDMALTLRSPEYLDQLALIDYLVRNMPDGVALALKEHPAMIGMVDADRLIGLLERYPSLALIDPSTNNYEVMRRAAAVITVNSKSGAEAGLLGRPVLVLGDAFYRNAPFSTVIDKLTSAPAALQATLREERPHERDAVSCWFAAVWEASVPGELYAEDEAGALRFAQSLVAATAPAG